MEQVVVSGNHNNVSLLTYGTGTSIYYVSTGTNTEIVNINFNIRKLERNYKNLPTLVTHSTRSTSAPSRMSEFTLEVNTTQSSYFTIVNILAAVRLEFRLWKFNIWLWLGLGLCYSSLPRFSVPIKFVDIRLITDGRSSTSSCHRCSITDNQIHSQRLSCRVTLLPTDHTHYYR